MTLRLISSEQVVFDGEVTSVTLPGEKGRFTVLHNHASLISTLQEGDVTYTGTDGSGERTHITGGLADIDNNVITVCIY